MAKTKPVTMDDIGGKVVKPSAADLANVAKNVKIQQDMNKAANARAAQRAPKPVPPKPVTQADRVKEAVKLRRQLGNEFNKKGGY